MSDPTSNEPEEQPEPNSLDLSDLQSFSFGTQWTDAGKQSKGGGKPRFDREGGGGRRFERRPGGGKPRERRPGGKPFGEKRQRSGRDHEGGERRPHAGGEERREGGRPPRRDAQFDRPYESAAFDVNFYPDDAGFSTIIKALRTNHITYELFDVAKIFLEKPDRFVASVTRKAPKGEKAERVFMSIPDGMPFETEEEAIQHVLSHYAEQFFDVEEVEVEAPSGNFPFVNRCGITKVVLGPPNYHRYEELVKLHHQSRLSNMPFEKFQSSIEQARDEESVNEWVESMKKAKRYSSKPEEGEEVQTFDSLSDAMGFLRTTQREKIVKPVVYARVPGGVVDKFPNLEASRAVKGELERQRRFPLETANAIRGRLRREKFSIYKKGSKGVTFICSVKRNFRAPGQVMSERLDRLILFLESHQGIKTKDLPPSFEAWLKEHHAETAFDEKGLFQDLHWLIADGYVSHFSDDSLFAHPVLDVSSHEPREAKPSKPGPQASEPLGQSVAAETQKAAVETEEAPIETPEPVESEAASSEVAETAADPEPSASEATPESVVAEVEAVPEEEATSEPVSEEPVEEAAETAEKDEAVEAVSESEPETEPEATPETEPKAETTAVVEESESSEASAEEAAPSEDKSDPEPEKASAEA